MGHEPIIEFDRFGFQYRAQKNPTLFDINLRVRRGEKILIAGPSGSGKSTLGCCLNGLIPFNLTGKTTGSLRIGGKKPEGVFQLSDLVGTVLQDTDSQFVGLTSGEDIAFALENLGVAQAEMRERVLAAAKMVGAETYLAQSPFNLSGGQKQRVSMAGVLIDGAPVLLFDEPLAALDPLTGKAAVKLIDEIARQTGCTVVIIEHRIEDVLYQHIDRVILMDEGRIIADTTPDEAVVSPKLRETGVRAPLYVAALEAAGVAVPAEKTPGRLDTLALTETDKAAVRAWAAEEPAGGGKPRRSDVLLAVKDLGFAYAGTDKAALGGVSFTLRSGEMTAIVGANGAGKSTLAKLLVGFERPSAGGMFYRGADMKDWTIPERAAKIGYVMQNPNQMLCKPLIYDEIALGPRARGLSEAEVKARVEAALAVCGLSRFAAWPVSALSYGQKKRVTIADALVAEPEILILDEPTAGQDWRHYTDIMEFLRELNALGITVLMITHDMHLCLEYAERALVFADGGLVADLPAYEILSDPDLAARASLRETSLYGLARLCGADARQLVRRYVRP